MGIHEMASMEESIGIELQHRLPSTKRKQLLEELQAQCGRLRRVGTSCQPTLQRNSRGSTGTAHKN